MITSFELKSIVYNIVKNSGVKALINGEIYNTNRPLNSPKNDIVIGSLASGNDTMNSSVVLVNIYAKDIQTGQTFEADYRTLSNATKHLLPFFDDVYIKEKKTNLDIEYQRDYKVEGVQENVSVIRIKTITKL
ncbi:hypothetical protein [Elizabethkingia bruuniana]|uniref:hypothetical protein n=1 Tax=Elizabethkingia bruuniana TaxID=1756149 RepID=UPI00398C8116